MHDSIPKTSTCFPAGTLIETPSGVLDIASLEEGDIVLGYDSRAKTLRGRSVLKVQKFGTNPLWELVFTDGSRMRTTDHHCFRVAGAWRKARHITHGDLVCCVDASSAGVVSRKVVSSGPTTEVEPVFNIIVDEDFSFIADGVIAHSFTHFRALRVLGWKIFGAFLRRSSGNHSESQPACGTLVIRQQATAAEPKVQTESQLVVKP